MDAPVILVSCLPVPRASLLQTACSAWALGERKIGMVQLRQAFQVAVYRTAMDSAAVDAQPLSQIGAGGTGLPGSDPSGFYGIVSAWLLPGGCECAPPRRAHQMSLQMSP